MPFKLNGDFLTSQLFDAQNNALAIVMEFSCRQEASNANL